MKVSHSVLVACLFALGGASAFAADASVTGLATTNYVKGAVESLDSSIATGNGIIRTVTVTDGKITDSTRSNVSDNDITDGTISQAKINGLSGALNAKQNVGNMVTKTSANEYKDLVKSNTQYPSMAVVDAMVDAAAQEASTDIGLVQADVADLKTGKQDKLTADNLKGAGDVSVAIAANGVITVTGNAAGTVTSGNTNSVSGGTVYTVIENAKTAAAETAQGKVDALANGAVKTNTDNIATLKGNASTEGSVAYQIAEAVNTINTTTGGLNTRVTTLESDNTTNKSDISGLKSGKQDKLTATNVKVAEGSTGNVVTGVSAANGVVTVTKGNVQPTLTNTNVKVADGSTGNVVTGVSAANGVVTITKGNVQATLGSSNVTTTGDTGVVKTVTANNGTVSVTRSAVTNDDVATNAAIAVGKLAGAGTENAPKALVDLGDGTGPKWFAIVNSYPDAALK